MNRENVLFAVVGLLLGYVVAFHLVVYVNQGQPAAAGSPAGMPAAQGDGGADRQRFLAAAEEASRAARAEPENFEAQLAAAEGYFRAGSFEEAVDFMTRANKLRPDDYDTVVRLGHIYSSAERFEDAERWYTAALAKRPADCNVRSELALTYYMREPRQPDRAISELRRCLDSNPNHAASLQNLAVMLMETQKYAEAESVLARLEKANPENEQLPRLREELRRVRGGAQQKAPAD